MEAFISAVGDGTLDADIACVVSNRPRAAGLTTAGSAGIATRVVDHTEYPTREDFDRQLAETVDAEAPDLVILAGFMRILTPVFTDRFAGRLLNIHPSLLPRYPGLNTHQRAIDNGDPEAGATVHYVSSELDGGPPLLHARVAIEPGDTADRLAARILPLEHQIYPAAAQLHLEGRIELRGGSALLDGQPLPPGGLDWNELPDRPIAGPGAGH